MEDPYRSNSLKNRTAPAKPEKETPILQKVVQGVVQTRPKGSFARLAEVLLAGRAGDIMSYIKQEVLIPGARNFIWAVITNGLSIALFDKASTPDRSPIGSRISYRNDRGYDSYYTASPRRDFRDDPAEMGPGYRSGFDYDRITFDDRGDAEAILLRMEDIIRQYGLVQVAAVYDLAGVTTDNYQFVQKYGWTDISSARPVRMRDGRYVLRLPKPLPID